MPSNKSSSSPRSWRTSWRAEGGGCALAAGVPAAAFFAGIAYIYEQLALAGPRALKGSSQLLLQPIGARASERPWSNERPAALALELCESAEEASLRLLSEFRERRKPVQFVEISAQRTDIGAALLPICIDEAPRQPCHHHSTSGGGDGGASHYSSSPSLVSGLRPCSYKRRRSPTRGNTTRSTS